MGHAFDDVVHGLDGAARLKRDLLVRRGRDPGVRGTDPVRTDFLQYSADFYAARGDFGGLVFLSHSRIV